MRVPGTAAQTLKFGSLAPSRVRSVPSRSPAWQVRISKRETAAMLGKASPRKPKVKRLSRSSHSLILEVAKR